MINKLKSLQKHQSFMKYFKNTSWLFTEKILRMVVGFFIGIWVVRYLGPERFGLFSYAQSFVGLFTAIATLGLDGIVVRELVKHENLRDKLIGTVFWLKLIGAIIVIILLAITVTLTSNDKYTNVLVFIIASATVFQSFNVIDMYFQSKVLSKYVVYANMISLFISSILKIIFILNESPLIVFAWIILFDSIILSLGLLYFYVKKAPHIRFNILIFNKKIALSLLKDSWPLIIAGTALMMNQKIDQIMIKEFLGVIPVGYYAAAIVIVDALIFIPFVLAKSIFPSFVQSYENDRIRFEKKIILSYRFFFIITLIPMCFIYVFADNIINLLYGSNFSNSAEVLKIYAFSILFSSIGAINMVYLRIINKQKKAMNRQVFNVGINIILNYIFIPIYGIVAAAYTSLFAIFFTTIIYDLFDKNLVNMNKLKLKAIGL